VPAYDDPHVVAGQGTVGLELMQQAAELGITPDQVLVPTSGGGLTAGTAIAVRALTPAAAIYGVEPEAFDDTRRSLAAGTLLKNPPDARSICDALQSSPPGRLTFAINRELLSGVLTVSDTEVQPPWRVPSATSGSSSSRAVPSRSRRLSPARSRSRDAPPRSSSRAGTSTWRPSLRP
jgi:threonine dehydratase